MYNEPTDPVRVIVIPEYGIDGVAITMGLRSGQGETAILRIDEQGNQNFEQHDTLTRIDNPTMRLTDDFARALLDALTRHYQGASDMHTVRADMLHERDRVDRLIGTLSAIAIDAAKYGVE